MIRLPTSDHCVYQALDAEFSVIYVGVTSHLFARLGQHQANSEWWKRAKAIEVECFDTRTQADEREKFLIRALMPAGNDRGNPLALMESEGVSIADVRAFIAARPKPVERHPRLVSLRQYAEESGIGIQTLRTRRDRHADFPRPVAIGGNRISLYAHDDLRRFMQAE